MLWKVTAAKCGGSGCVDFVRLMMTEKGIVLFASYGLSSKLAE